MQVVTAAQMRALDQITIEQYHVPSLTLMENAGQGVAAFVRNSPLQGPIAIFLGKGNNAGDGLVAARYLMQNGFSVILVPLFPVEQFSPDTQQQWQRLQNLRPKIFSFEKDKNKIAEAVCFIDAIFGTGLTKNLEGIAYEAVEWLNQTGKPIFSIDIPSGLSADTGEPQGTAIRAHTTMTLGLPKVGFFLPPAAPFVGKLETIDIGIPKEAIQQIKIKTYLTDPSDFMSLRKQRDLETHKGTYGHVLVVAGSKEMLGAGYLASLACLRAGAGLVSFALPKTSYEKFNTSYAELIPIAIPDGGAGFFNAESLPGLRKALEEKTVVVCGPGIGREKETGTVMKQFLPEVQQPLVLDADGIAALTKQRKSVTVLTPHPGEMGQLLGKSTEAIQKNRLEFAGQVARDFEVYLVLKGHHTITACPDGMNYFNPTGNPGMATAGMGDVLAGWLGGLLAQGFPAKEAVIGGVYSHGQAGDLIKKEKGEKGLIASDLLQALPQTLWNG